MRHKRIHKYNMWIELYTVVCASRLSRNVSWSNSQNFHNMGFQLGKGFSSSMPSEVTMVLVANLNGQYVNNQTSLQQIWTCTTKIINLSLRWITYITHATPDRKYELMPVYHITISSINLSMNTRTIYIRDYIMYSWHIVKSIMWYAQPNLDQYEYVSTIHNPQYDSSWR